MALKRTLRLRKTSGFQRVRQQGRSSASRLLILAYASNEQATLHIGLVVSKRISKHAVQRNYIKRLLVEAIRPVLADIPVGWDLVLSAKHPIIGVSLPILRQDITMLLRRANLLGPAHQVKTHSSS